MLYHWYYHVYLFDALSMHIIRNMCILIVHFFSDKEIYSNDIHSFHSTLHQLLAITHYLIVHYQHYMLANSSIKYCTTVSNPLQYMLW